MGRKREIRTLELMIGLYCRDIHGRDGSHCPECKSLMDYALARLERCPFMDEKPVCSACTIHCYRPDMREKVRRVMQHSGPRMIFRHPVLAFLHLLDARRKRHG